MLRHVPIILLLSFLLLIAGCNSSSDNGLLNLSLTDAPVDTAFLPAGTYTRAFTCEAALDNPGTADNITFTFAGSVPVAAQTTFRVVLTSPNS